MTSSSMRELISKLLILDEDYTVWSQELETGPNISPTMRVKFVEKSE